MMNRNRYYLSIPDLARARGSEPALSYVGVGPEHFASALQAALRSACLFKRWRALQPTAEEIDPALGATDAQAVVNAHITDLHVDVEVTTGLPMSLLRQRLDWLIGTNWQLHDVRGA